MLISSNLPAKGANADLSRHIHLATGLCVGMKCPAMLLPYQCTTAY